MKTWKITGWVNNEKTNKQEELPTLHIEAEDFDTALKIARKQNKNYCCGQREE